MLPVTGFVQEFAADKTGNHTQSNPHKEGDGGILTLIGKKQTEVGGFDD